MFDSDCAVRESFSAGKFSPHKSVWIQLININGSSWSRPASYIHDLFHRKSLLFHGISPYFKSSILPQNSLSQWIKKPGAGQVGFQGSKVTSDGGLIIVRELDERLGFGELVAQNLADARANIARFSFADLLRQSVYSRLAGYRVNRPSLRQNRLPHRFTHDTHSISADAAFDTEQYAKNILARKCHAILIL